MKFSYLVPYGTITVLYYSTYIHILFSYIIILLLMFVNETQNISLHYIYFAYMFIN